MQLQYQEVPNMISGKDLDYLSDMFSWNYGAYKNVINAKTNINDQEIKNIFEKAENLFHGNITKVLQILNQGGCNE